MDEAAGVAADADADKPAPAASPSVIAIDEKGDIILDVIFETSKETLKRARSQVTAAPRIAKPAAPAPVGAPLSPRSTLSYRVSVEALKGRSKYFTNLFTNPHFSESKRISDAHGILREKGHQPSDADADDLPRIEIVDDDEATQASNRDVAFEDMLRLVHRKPAKATKITMAYATTLAIIADRFDCTDAVARSANMGAKFKGPITSTRAYFDSYGKPTETEKIVRQKVLIALLLRQPTQLAAASRELVLRGSTVWGPYHDPDDLNLAAWWHLPEGVEEELRYRRECILNTISSVQRHFLSLYSSKERQCKLGYDSSPACDSFQLGQMIKFLVSKNLLFLMDYSPSALDAAPDATCIDIQELLATLRQCPSYQLDKNHVNCGLRIRIEPILDYLRTMLSTNVISIPLVEWKKSRDTAGWTRDSDKRGGDTRQFIFTRAVSQDQRLRYEGVMYADKMAKALFTSESWDWTPEV